MGRVGAQYGTKTSKNGKQCTWRNFQKLSMRSFCTNGNSLLHIEENLKVTKEENKEIKEMQKPITYTISFTCVSVPIAMPCATNIIELKLHISFSMERLSQMNNKIQVELLDPLASLFCCNGWIILDQIKETVIKACLHLFILQRS